MNKKGRLIKAERYLIALFRADRVKGRVEFMGLAMDGRHASQVMCGQTNMCDRILRMIAGTASSMHRPYQDWYPVKIVLVYNKAIYPDDIYKMVHKAQQLAEIKLAAMGIMNLKPSSLQKLDKEDVDGLTQALSMIKGPAKKTVVAPEPSEPDPGDEWNVYYTPENLNILEDDNEF